MTEFVSFRGLPPHRSPLFSAVVSPGDAERVLHFPGAIVSREIAMADRRPSERLWVGPESLEQILPEPVPQLAVVKVAERLIVPAETLDRVEMDEQRPEPEDRTEPIRLSFLALLAERDPAGQARLNP